VTSDTSLVFKRRWKSDVVVFVVIAEMSLKTVLKISCPLASRLAAQVLASAAPAKAGAALRESRTREAQRAALREKRTREVMMRIGISFGKSEERLDTARYTGAGRHGTLS